MFLYEHFTFYEAVIFLVWFVSLVIIVLFRTGKFTQTWTDHGILSQIKKNKHHSDCFWELACRSLYFRTLRQDYFICEVALVGTLFINTHTHIHTCTHNLPESKGTWNYNGTREHDLLVKELINAILLISQFYYFCCVTVSASSEFKVGWFKAQKN